MVVFLKRCFFGSVVEFFLWWCGGVLEFLWWCGGVFFCGGVLVVMFVLWWCFSGGVFLVLFLW